MSAPSARWRIGPRDWAPLGRRLRAVWPRGTGLVVYLEGPLGAGKTSFVRGLVRAWDPGADVTSPTFILREDHEGEGFHFVHVDLYRLRGPADVEDLALLELPAGASLLVEWPEHGCGHLPRADLHCVLEPVEGARILEARGESPPGVRVLEALVADPWLLRRATGDGAD